MVRAFVLGLIQGPTEMAPVSSSAHISMMRWVWEGRPPVGRRPWEGERGRGAADRKSLEVALHGGGAVAIAFAIRGRLQAAWGRTAAGSGRQGLSRSAVMCLAAGPAALAGWLGERPIERGLGGPASTAAGLVGGAVAMAMADRHAGIRALEDAGAGDGLALGIAQAAALMPGVSRRGATLAAARLRGFARSDADELSWLTGMPVIAGACALKGMRLRGGGKAGAGARGTGESGGGKGGDGKLPGGGPRGEKGEGEAAEMAIGGGAAFLSTLASARLLARGGGPLLPFCLYRVGLALAILWGARTGSRSGP